VRVLEWRPRARSDLMTIVEFIADDSPDAALKLLDDIEEQALNLIHHPKAFRVGRVPGTREMVVRSNYIVVYAEDEKVVSILRVLHAAQQWPPAERN